MYPSTLKLCLVFALCCLVQAGKEIILSNRRFDRGYEVYRDVSLFPYLLQLRNHDGSFLCAGSLIDSMHVLTAAECFDNVDYSTVSVVAGASKVTDEGTSRQIVKISKHPTRHINIAVLKLESALTEFTPMELGDVEIEAFDEDDLIKALGWRHLAHRKSATKEFSIFKAKIAEQSKCEEAFYAAGTKKYFCLIGDEFENEPCVSDMGGPVVFENHIIGVVSKGHKCGEPYHLTAVTELHDLLPFIKECLH